MLTSSNAEPDTQPFLSLTQSLTMTGLERKDLKLNILQSIYSPQTSFHNSPQPLTFNPYKLLLFHFSPYSQVEVISFYNLK